MSSVVITGNARGFGYAMTKLFVEREFDAVLCDISKEALQQAEQQLKALRHKGKILLKRKLLKKGTWANSQVLRKFKSFRRWQFSGSLSSLRQIILLCLHFINLSQDPPLGCACNLQPRLISK